MAGQRQSLFEWQQSLPFASDKVTVTDLATIANASYDVWGRPKLQPVLVSVTLSLVQRTSTAAASDSVDASTVHYGTLSKAILAKLQLYQGERWAKPEEVGYAVAQAALEVAPKPVVLSAVEIDVRYPKATFFGEGLSVLFNFRPTTDDAAPTPDTSSELLHLHRLQIPALIGVNAHERLAKQKLIVSLWIDRVNPLILEHSFEVEQLVFKTVEESSYETLESLAEELAARIIKYIVIPYHSHLTGFPEVAGIRVKIEKPSAVPMAEAPAVEIYRSAESQDTFGRRMIAELGSKRPRIPFPLAGRLDEFLENWKLD